MIHKHKVIFTIATLSLFLSACSTLQKLSDDDPNNDLAITVGIQFATIKVIENGNTQERAQRIIEILDETRSFISLTQEIKVSQIASHIKNQINYTKLDAADTLLVNAIIDSLSLKLTKTIQNEASEHIDENVLISLDRVYDIITQTARLYIEE